MRTNGDALALFVNPSGDNYRLTASGTWSGIASDGADLGADIDAIEVLTAIAESGDNSGAPAGRARLRLRIR